VQPPEIWDGGVGFVSKEMIQAHCPAPAADIQVNFTPVQLLKNTCRNLEAISFAQWKNQYGAVSPSRC
jgi:cytochrome-b5 reductase